MDETSQHSVSPVFWDPDSGQVWHVLHDDENNIPYYYCEETQLSTYDRPAFMDSESIVCGDWTMMFDPASGACYYLNGTSGESTWDRPSDFPAPLRISTAAATDPPALASPTSYLKLALQASPLLPSPKSLKAKGSFPANSPLRTASSSFLLAGAVRLADTDSAENVMRPRLPTMSTQSSGSGDDTDLASGSGSGSSEGDVVAVGSCDEDLLSPDIVTPQEAAPVGFAAAIAAAMKRKEEERAIPPASNALALTAPPAPTDVNSPGTEATQTVAAAQEAGGDSGEGTSEASGRSRADEGSDCDSRSDDETSDDQSEGGETEASGASDGEHDPVATAGAALRLTSSAVDIQRVYRGAAARRRVNFLRRQRSEKDRAALAAAVRIQCWVRVQQAKRTAADRQSARRFARESTAAVGLQRVGRGYVARQQRRRLLLAKGTVQAAAATAVQCCFRRWRARRFLAALRLVKAAERERWRHASAASVQGLYRGHVARRLVAGQLRAVLRLQCWARCCQATQRVAAMRQANSASFAGRQSRGAIAVQRLYRGHLGRKRAAEMLSVRQLTNDADVAATRNSSAVRVQKLVRGWLARIRVIGIRQRRQELRLNAASVNIQRLYRGHASRARTTVAVRQSASVTIQRIVRGWLARLRHPRSSVVPEKGSDSARRIQRWRRAIVCRRKAVGERGRRRRGAVDIQRVWRGGRGRAAARRVRAGNAAFRIQCWTRQALARRVVVAKRRQAAEQLLLKQRAVAVHCQRLYRGHLARVLVSRIKAERRRRAAESIQLWVRYQRRRVAGKTKRRVAATSIQRVWRGYCCCRGYRELLTRRATAALILQCRARQWQAKQRVNVMRQRAAELARRKRKGAVGMQAAYRGHVARTRVAVLRQRRWDAAVLLQCWARQLAAAAALKRLRDERKRMNEAATEVQRLFRGHRGRQRAAITRRQRHSCIRIQCCVRMWLAVRLRQRLHRAWLTRNALRIQCWYRRQLAVLLLHALRRAKASITVQCAWRCHRARLITATRRHQRHVEVGFRAVVRRWVAVRSVAFCRSALVLARRTQASIRLQRWARGRLVRLAAYKRRLAASQMTVGQDLQKTARSMTLDANQLVALYNHAAEANESRQRSAANDLARARTGSDIAKHERLLDLTNRRIVPRYIDDVIAGGASNPRFDNQVGVGLWEAACGTIQSPMLSLSLPKLAPRTATPDVADLVQSAQVNVARKRPQSAKSTRSETAESARGGAWSIRPTPLPTARRSSIGAAGTPGLQLSFKREASALHAACWFGQLSVVRCLLENGVSPNLIALSALGSTPVHDAASAGHADVIAVLMEFGGDATAQDSHGDTPLHHAARGGHMHAVRVLLGHLDALGQAVRRWVLRCKNNAGKRPLDVASNGRCRELLIPVVAPVPVLHAALQHHALNGSMLATHTLPNRAAALAKHPLSHDAWPSPRHALAPPQPARVLTNHPLAEPQRRQRSLSVKRRSPVPL